MGRFSVSIDDDVQEEVEEWAEEYHDGNRSAAVEELLQHGLEYDDVVDERDDLEARLEDLRRQLAEVRSREDDVDEIVRYVEHERSIQERKARAGIVTRAKWFLTGMEGQDEE